MDPNKGVTLLIFERVGIAETAAMPSPIIPTESKAPTLDHRNARSVVEAYVASALDA